MAKTIDKVTTNFVCMPICLEVPTCLVKFTQVSNQVSLAPKLKLSKLSARTKHTSALLAVDDDSTLLIRPLTGTEDRLLNFSLHVPLFPSTVRYDPANPKVRFLGNFFYYSGNCNEPEAQMQIKRNFLGIINQAFIPSSSYCRQKPADCTVENVNVYCGEAAAPVRRRRRSAKEVYIKVDFLAKEKLGTSSTYSDLKNVSK